MKEPTAAHQKQWDEDGYLVFESAIDGDLLHRLQDAFDHWTAACKPDWLERVATGKTAPSFYDFPESLKKDDAFLEIADHPAYYGCLRAFCDDEPILQDVGPRIVPLSPLSYTSWHADTPHSRPLHIKIQIYLSDMVHGGGEFAYIPGSHKPDSGPSENPRRQEDMPGMVRFTGKAGTAVMFNCYGWHTALDNDGTVPRKSIIVTYHKRTENDRVDRSPFKFLEERCTTDERRRFLSLQA
jgi:hypothetical protein